MSAPTSGGIYLLSRNGSGIRAQGSETIEKPIKMEIQYAEQGEGNRVREQKQGSEIREKGVSSLISDPRPLFSFLRSLLPLLLHSTRNWSLLHGNSLEGDFVGDDHIIVVKTRRSIPLEAAEAVCAELLGRGHNEESNYRPLTNLSFALNYAAGGLNPWGYHLINLLLHALNGLLVYKTRAPLHGTGSDGVNNIVVICSPSSAYRSCEPK